MTPANRPTRASFSRRRPSSVMPTKNFASTFVAGLLIAFSTTTHAATHCTETITRAILHLNGHIYFTTNQTCPNWCQVDWGTSEKNKNGLAMLLAAQTAGRTITFYWPNVAACSDVNATYASPDYMMLN